MRRTTVIRTALAAVAALALVAGGSAAQAAGPKGKTSNLVFKTVLKSAGTTLEDLPGGHVYGWNDLQGTTQWGNQSATVRFLGVVDYTNGSGPFGGFVTITRADGTKLAFNVDGMAVTPLTESGTADAKFSGTFTVIGGSGSFSGATGFGTMDGFRRASLGGQVNLDFTVRVTRR